MREEFDASQDNLVEELEKAIGGRKDDKGYVNFDKGCSEGAGRWQILSLNRNGPVGSIVINRSVKERLRRKRLDDAVRSNNVSWKRKWMRFTKPKGPEQIVYGDKVICVRNHHRKPWLYGARESSDREFLANGEVGIVTGQKQYGHANPKFTHVELMGRADRNFSFTGKDFTEDGQPFLELAYALTVHKAQGSEFGSVILVLPTDSRLISREMIYTALTRQRRQLWVLHQGSFERFLALRQHMFSDIAGRFTNLLRQPVYEPVHEIAVTAREFAGSKRTFLAEKLIHRTTRGEMVSSKNELFIAKILHELEKQGCLKYEVEPQLPFDDGRGRWADFRIEAKGDTWYWEHCGRMDDEHYRERWLRKKKLYAANGFSVYSKTNRKGRLIVTEDAPATGLDALAIEELAHRLFK